MEDVCVHKGRTETIETVELRITSRMTKACNSNCENLKVSSPLLTGKVWLEDHTNLCLNSAIDVRLLNSESFHLDSDLSPSKPKMLAGIRSSAPFSHFKASLSSTSIPMASPSHFGCSAVQCWSCRSCPEPGKCSILCTRYISMVIIQYTKSRKLGLIEILTFKCEENLLFIIAAKLRGRLKCTFQC